MWKKTREVLEEINKSWSSTALTRQGSGGGVSAVELQKKEDALPHSSITKLLSIDFFSVVTLLQNLT